MNDQTRDTNWQRLHSLLGLYGAPEFVKAASPAAVGTDGHGDLPRHLFADVAGRSLPCHTGAACYTSMLYLLDADHLDKSSADLFRDRIRQSAGHFGCLAEIDALEARYKAASAGPDENLTDDDFVYVVDYPGHGKDRRLPVRNRQEFTKASTYLDEFRDHFTYRERRMIAERLLKRADALGIEAPNRAVLEKQAGQAWGDAHTAAELLFNRARCLRAVGSAPDKQQELAKLALDCLAQPAKYHAPAERVKIAELIDDVDRDHRLKGLPQPEELFSFTTADAKAVAGAVLGNLKSGAAYSLDEIAAIDPSVIRETFGQDMFDRMTDGLSIDGKKAAAVLPELSAADAKLFEAVASDAGVRPLYRDQVEVSLLGPNGWAG